MIKPNPKNDVTTPIFSPYLQISWAAARLSCACSHSGELVSITSAEENSLVSDIAGNTTLEKIWIGIVGCTNFQFIGYLLNFDT